jgi:hypothetical protein
VESLIKYYDTVGGAFGMKTVKLGKYIPSDVLPQYFYDRFDWDTLVKDVAEVYGSLPEAEKANVTIASENYGCAGAVDLLGEKLGLPKAASGRLNYYYFSRGNIRGGTWIVIDAPVEYLSRIFGRVTPAKASVSEYRQPHVTGIYVCREPKFTVEEIREGIKDFR